MFLAGGCDKSRSPVFKGMITQTDPQGVPHVFDLGYCRELALISVEDYCAGIANYRVVDEKMLDWKS